MIIRGTILGLVAVIGLALCSGDKAVGSSCGRAEVQAICGGVYHLRPGQVRRAQRREARAARRQSRLNARAACHQVAAVHNRCGGVAVIVPQVHVEVASGCCD